MVPTLRVDSALQLNFHDVHLGCFDWFTFRLTIAPVWLLHIHSANLSYLYTFPALQN
ncbi:hypothetical protein SAMN05880586_103399 [Paenibacillus sp. RU5M]|nr:hypothetical protein SAMN05880586_103399 [Paenibacillus sp. RU5M]